MSYELFPFLLLSYDLSLFSHQTPGLSFHSPPQAREKSNSIQTENKAEEEVVRVQEGTDLMNLVPSTPRVRLLPCHPTTHIMVLEKTS